MRRQGYAAVSNTLDNFEGVSVVKWKYQLELALAVLHYLSEVIGTTF